MKPYLKFDTVTRFPQTPLQIEQKPLFKLPDTIMQRRKTAQQPFRRSLHQNKSPVNFEKQKIEELRSTIAQLTEVNTELATLNQALQDQITKLQENNRSLQQQIHQMNVQIDDLKINNRHLRSQDNSVHVQSKTFDQRLQDQSNHIVFLQLQLRKLNDQLEQQKTQQINHTKIEAINELESICLELRSFVLCKYCNQELKEPVTIIPCAHSYCKQCKLGYQKNCFLCGPDEEMEASYVNLSLMPIVKFYKKSLQIKEILK